MTNVETRWAPIENTGRRGGKLDEATKEVRMRAACGKLSEDKRHSLQNYNHSVSNAESKHIYER